MPEKRKIVYIERKKDANDVERIYGYTIDGAKYFLNLIEVMQEYERRGINSFKRVA